MSDYERIEKAIAYLVAHVAEQPSLDQVAAQVHLSPFHFQRLFCQWAGTTPKRFLQVLTVEHGKQLLQQSQLAAQSLLATAQDMGLSGSSRLHDHFVQLEAMTPGEFKQQGQGVQLDYGVHATPFGSLFVAMTARGICRASFVDFSSLEQELASLRQDWPLANIQPNQVSTAVVVNRLFQPQLAGSAPLSVQVSGTNFQVAVWRALLKIPSGSLMSYSQLATTLGCPTASRAVANAIGANPVAFLIPCHRVIRQSGALGGYRWGVTKKQLIQTWERLQIPADALNDEMIK
ncbi:MAG: methylated-DNA--[protein]-cysteine S-methyltransferase [Moraxellaceae bacterium]|nr:MAG: methylated-DNA--[protein]-cysteine S-methyltransferase [Moraxellaceae bacterium]